MRNHPIIQRSIPSNQSSAAFDSKLARLVGFLLLPLAFFLSVTATMPAQTYPTFGTCQQLPNIMTEKYGPSLTTFNGLVYMAYVGPNTGNIYVASSSDGLHFSGAVNTGINPGSFISPSITVWRSQLYLAYNSGGQVYVITSTNGSLWTGPQAVNFGGYPVAPPIDADWQPQGSPAIFGESNGYIILGYAVQTYDPSQGTSPTNILVGYSTDGVNYFGITSAAGNLENYIAVSDPTITLFNNQLSITWLTGPGTANTVRYPTVVLFNTPENGFYQTSLVKATSGQFSHNPAAVAINGGLFIYGQSYYTSEDNLWAIGTVDGTTFNSAHEYGQTLSGSPGITAFGGGLVEVGRSKYNSNMWACH